MSTLLAGTPELNKPMRTEAEFRAELRAGALEKARVVVEGAATKLRGLLLDAEGDKEACQAIQSALDGLHDYGQDEINALIESRSRDERIEALELSEAESNRRISRRWQVG